MESNMPKHLKWYKNKVKKNTYRNIQRKRNYDSQGWDNFSSKSVYTTEELKRVMEHSIPDRQLAKELGRSIRSIQIARWRHKEEVLN